MTISITRSHCEHAANGATTAFPVKQGAEGIWFSEATELTVWLIEGTTWTLQTLGAHYTVAGAGSADGTVTFLTAPPAGRIVRIERHTPLTQTVALANATPFSPTEVMGALDKLTRMAQDLWREMATDEELRALEAAIRSWVETTFNLAADHLAQSAANAATASAAAAAAQAYRDQIAAIVANPNFDLAPGTVLLDNIAGGFNGTTTTFDLRLMGVPKTPASAAQLIVHLGDAYQTPGTAYTVSGSTITFASAPPAGLTCDILLVQIDTSGLDSAVAAATAAAASAATSATSAASSASAAATSATAAEAAYDSFDDRYLGPKATNPTTDNDGNALLVGALYFNTTTSRMRVWTGSAWDDAYVPASSSVTSFNGRTGAVTPASGDYSAAQISGISAFGQSLIDDADAATARATLAIATHRCDDIAGGFDGSATTFTLTVGGSAVTPRSAANVVCALGGAYQTPETAFTVSGSTITFASAPAAGLTCSIQIINA